MTGIGQRARQCIDGKVTRGQVVLYLRATQQCNVDNGAVGHDDTASLAFKVKGEICAAERIGKFAREREGARGDRNIDVVAVATEELVAYRPANQPRCRAVRLQYIYATREQI